MADESGRAPVVEPGGGRGGGAVVRGDTATVLLMGLAGLLERRRCDDMGRHGEVLRGGRLLG